MAGNVKVKVDEYQDFLLRRYGLEKLAEQDPGQARRKLQAQLNANSPQDGEPFWGEVPAVDVRHDLDTLRFYFTLIAPTILKNGSDSLPALPICGGSYMEWDTGQNLPFPPALVQDITLRDLVFLKKTFGLSGADRYTEWENVYLQVNRHITDRKEDLRSRKQRHRKRNRDRYQQWDKVADREGTGDWEEAADLAEPVDPEYAQILRERADVSEIEAVPVWLRTSLPPEVPVAPVFLASARAYLIWQNVESAIRGTQRIKDRTIPDLEDRAAPFFKALDVFEEAMRREDDRRDPYPLQSNIGSWIKRMRLGVNLAEVLDRNADERFRKRVEQALGEGELQIGPAQELRLSHVLALLRFGVEVELAACKGVPELWKDRFYAPNAPGDLVEGHRPQVIYQAFNAVAELIGRYWQKWGARQKAQELFDLWGIEIELEAARQTQRRKRKP